MQLFYVRTIRVVVIIASIAALTASYFGGVTRKYDTRITYGYEYDAWSVSVAVSRLVYGLHEGYVGYRKIAQVTQQILAPDGVLSPTSIHFLSDRAAIQKALDEARKIDPKTLPNYYPLDGNFVSIYYEDIGLADLYTLAFEIFGFHPDSMYRFYFLLVAFSMAIYIWEYRDRLGPLATLALLAVTFPIFIFSSFFEDPLMPSVNANRFLATLGFIPALHALWALKQQVWNRSSILRLVVQGVIFAFAISCRKAVQFQLIVVVLAWVMLLWQELRARKAYTREGQTASFGTGLVEALRRSGPTRAMALFLGAILIYDAAQTLQLNPIYFTECAIPQHTTWHSVMLGLSMHPEWEKYNTIAPKNVAGTDTVAWGAFENYEKARGEPFTCSSTGGLYKVALHEKVIRSLIVHFLMEHPVYGLELYGYYKPLILIRGIDTMLGSVESAVWVVLLALSIVAGWCTTQFGLVRKRPAFSTLVIPAVAFVIALIPPIVAYGNRFMPDILWLLTINAFVWVWYVTATITALGPQPVDEIEFGQQGAHEAAAVRQDA